MKTAATRKTKDPTQAHRAPYTDVGPPVNLRNLDKPLNGNHCSHYQGNVWVINPIARLTGKGGREIRGSSAKGLGNPLSDGREKRRTRTTWKKSKKHSSPRPETTPTIPGSPPNTQTHTTLGRRSQLATARPTCEQANPSWSASGHTPI